MFESKLSIDLFVPKESNAMQILFCRSIIPEMCFLLLLVHWLITWIKFKQSVGDGGKGLTAQINDKDNSTVDESRKGQISLSSEIAIIVVKGARSGRMRCFALV